MAKKKDAARERLDIKVENIAYSMDKIHKDCPMK
jgi:hypothetical protein